MKECWTMRMSGSVRAGTCKNCVYVHKRENKKIPSSVRCWEYLSCKEPCEIRTKMETDSTKEKSEASLLGRGKKVLVLDDSKTLRNLIRAILEEYEYEVDTASIGREALDKSNRWMPDVMICDINLAGSSLSGLDVLAQVKRFKRDTRVIMLSSKADRETVEFCLQSGADAFIPKPFKNEELVSRIALALAGGSTEAA